MSALSLSEAIGLLYVGATYDRVCVRFSNAPHERKNYRMQEILERAISTDTHKVSITWFPGDGISFELTFDPTTVTTGGDACYHVTVPGGNLAIREDRALATSQSDRVFVELNDDLRLIPAEAFRSIVTPHLKV